MYRAIGAAVAVALCWQASPASAANDDDNPISAVVLVDESGSLSAQAVAREQDAAAALVTSDLSTSSRFMVAGFGSSNRAGQTAVRPYCDFITASNRAARTSLIECARRVHRREAPEGNDTDHAKAIQFALDRLGSGAGRTPVVFLLTDGKLDVHDSPGYGRDPERRNAEALRRIEQQMLPDARRRGIQIWPLGFGGGVSRDGLEQFAAGAAGANAHCATLPSAKPHAVVVTELGDVIHSLVQTLQNARCGAVGPPDRGDVTHGGAHTLHVDIPPIATDGAITVTKDEASFVVDFFGPDGKPVPAGTVDGQAVERTGVGGRVETLRIRNPRPGRWTVKVTDSRGRARSSPVSAFAEWQGTLQASVYLLPELARPGRDVAVEVRVLSRDGVVPGSSLRDVQAAARATGAVGDIAVPLRLTGDVFKGTFNVPSDATGSIGVIARVSGIGVASDERSESVEIDTGAEFIPLLEFDVPAEVHPGDALQGTVSTTNLGTARPVTLRLGDLSAGALVTVSPDLKSIPTGKSRVAFAVAISHKTRSGQLYGNVDLVDAGGRRIAGATFDTTVVKKPPIPVWLWFVIGPVTAFLLVVLIRSLLAVRRRRRPLDTAGLVARINGPGKSLPPVTSLGGPRFVIDFVDDGVVPRALLVDESEPVGGLRVVIARHAQGVRVSIGGGSAEDRRFGEEIDLEPSPYRLAILDEAAADDGSDPDSGLEETGREPVVHQRTDRYR